VRELRHTKHLTECDATRMFKLNKEEAARREAYIKSEREMEKEARRVLLAKHTAEVSVVDHRVVTLFYKQTDDIVTYWYIPLIIAYFCFVIPPDGQFETAAVVAFILYHMRRVWLPIMCVYMLFMTFHYIEYTGWASCMTCCSGSRTFVTKAGIGLPADSIYGRKTRIPAFYLYRWHNYIARLFLPLELMEIHDFVKGLGYTHYRQVSIDLILLAELHKKHKGVNPTANSVNNLWRDSETVDPTSNNKISKDTIQYFIQQWIFISEENRAILGNRGKAVPLN